MLEKHVLFGMCIMFDVLSDTKKYCGSKGTVHK